MKISEMRKQVAAIENPYVVVEHKPTGRMFVLNGAYHVMEKVAQEDAVILWTIARGNRMWDE